MEDSNSRLKKDQHFCVMVLFPIKKHVTHIFRTIQKWDGDEKVFGR